MKKLKTVIIILFLFQSIFSFCQTKEETLHWLSDFAKELSWSKISEEDIGSHSGWVELNNLDSISGGNYFDRWSVRIKDLLIQDVSKIVIVKEEFFSYFILKAQLDAVMIESFSRVDYKKKEGTSKASSIKIYFTNEIEKANVERVIKAVLHLAKLNGAKPIPNVTKSTF